MRAFDLEKALAGKPVVTRDGRKVLEMHFFKLWDFQPVRAVLDANEYSHKSLERFNIDGSWDYNNKENEKDLFMATEKKTMWLCYCPEVHYDESTLRASNLFFEKKKCEKRFSLEENWKIIPVEIEL